MNNNKDGVNPTVSAIDLTALCGKLAEEKGWGDADLQELVRQYKMYLNLRLVHPDKALVPTRFIDEMWHAHILDTRAYADDCHRVFGEFLHHYPYLGVGGEQEKARLDDAFQQTATLWHAAYGEPYAQVPFPARRGQLSVPAQGLAVASRCADHACHSPSSCACRSPGACK